MTNKQKILILGIGNAQVDAIRYCKSHGYEVHAISYNAEGPGLIFADYFKVIDIADKTQVASYCYQNKIDFVYSVGSDIAMPTIGFVAEKLGLPFLINEATAILLKNKDALRKHLNEYKISELQYIEVGNIEESESWNLFPAILKPVDSQGQRGVYEIRSREDIPAFFNKAIENSYRKKVIIEEYIQGNEISVNSFVFKGKIIYNFISDRIVVENLPGGIAKGHNFPTQMSVQLQEKTIDIVEKSIQSLNIMNGPVYYQLKYSGSDVKIIEIAGRLDGCHLWRLIKMNYGIDLLDLTFKTLFNLPVEFKEPGEEKGLRIEFPLEKPGFPFKKDNYLSLVENSLFFEFYYHENEIVRAVNGHLEKTGVIIC